MTISAHGLTAKVNLGLSTREAQCLLSVAAGLTTKQTARDLGIAPGTVEKRLLAATTKLGVTKRAALVVEAFRRGLISFTASIQPDFEPQEETAASPGILLA